MVFVAMLAKGFIVQETFPTDPTHDWWRSDGDGEAVRLVGTHAFPICWHTICRELNIFATTFLRKVLLAPLAFEIGQETEKWSKW